MGLFGLTRSRYVRAWFGTASLTVLGDGGRGDVGVQRLGEHVMARQSVMLAAFLVQPKPPARALRPKVFHLHFQCGRYARKGIVAALMPPLRKRLFNLPSRYSHDSVAEEFPPWLTACFGAIARKRPPRSRSRSGHCPGDLRDRAVIARKARHEDENTIHPWNHRRRSRPGGGKNRALRSVG
jgi:hypothetical protein